jgi:hypothetical protein
MKSQLEMAATVENTALPSRNGLTPKSECVVTHRDFLAADGAVWQALIFYEEVNRRPPLILRRLVPEPVAAEGAKSELNATIRCRYASGYLLKRITNIANKQIYAFEIIEQALPLGKIRLLAGEYRLHRLSSNQTRLVLTTRYQSLHHPRWLCRRLEALVCHSFHRHLLRGIEDNLS